MTSGDVADAKPFDDWYDLIETNLRPKVRGFIGTTIPEERDTALARPRCGCGCRGCADRGHRIVARAR